jgi:hypothetical protein
MKKETADTLCEIALRYTNFLDQSIVQREGDLAYRRVAGTLMGYLFTNLLMPVFAQYPELQPPEFADEATEGGLRRESASAAPVDLPILIEELDSDLDVVERLIQEDDTIQEKSHALMDLEEVNEHFGTFREFVTSVKE